MSSDKLQEIIELEKRGYRATAIRRLRRFLDNHPDSAEAWYYLARFETEPRLQKIAIDRALSLKPDDEDAREFLSVLLEEYPELERRSSRLARFVVIVVLLVGVIASALVGLKLLQDQPQEVVVVVPTQTPPPTVPPIMPVEAPTDTPEIDAETPESAVIPPTETAPPTQDFTPIPTVTPSAIPTIPAVAPAESQIVRLAIEDSGENLAAQFADMLSAQFDARTLFFEPSAEPISDPATQDDAALVIYGAASPEQISLTLSGQEHSQVYAQQPDLLPLRRMDSPWILSLNIARSELDDPAALGSLIGAVAYVGYQHQKVIDNLAPLYETPVTLNENQSMLAFMLAYSYQALGQQEDALRIYDILNTNSTETIPAVAFNRAYAIGQTGDVESAVRLYLSLLEGSPGDGAFIQSNIGGLYLAADDLNAAQLAFEEAIRLDPNAARPYVERGKLLEAQNQFNRALEDYSAAIEHGPTFAPAFYERARLRSDLALLDDALRDIDTAIGLMPNSPDFYGLRGHILLMQDDPETATTAIERALSLGANSPELHDELAAAYFDLGNLDGAVRESNNALAIDQENAEAWYQRGRAYLARNELASAINDLNQALSYNPDLVDALVARCTVNARMGDDGAAALDCDSALVLDNDNGYALEQRGLIRARAGDRAGAVEDFEEAITYEPDAYEALYNLGYFALQEKRYEEAIRYLTRTLEVTPYLGKAYAARGVAYRLTGQWELAITDLEQAITIIPEDVYSHYELGLANRYLADRANDTGDSARAKELYQDAAAAFLEFLNASQPGDQFVPEAQAGLNYVNSALTVIGG